MRRWGTQDIFAGRQQETSVHCELGRSVWLENWGARVDDRFWMFWTSLPKRWSRGSEQRGTATLRTKKWCTDTWLRTADNKFWPRSHLTWWTLANKLIIGLDFAVTLSSPDSSCVLFDITSEQSVELKWLILNKHKRWFHSSRVKFLLVSMSASWFLVSMYVIWILGSKLILSNNQSRATLWDLETCLIVGLLPFFIIFDHCFVVFKHIQ